jgi:hypothetical protein
VSESNVFQPGSKIELRAAPREGGGSRVEMIVRREYRRGPKGRIAATVNHVGGHRLFGWYLGTALKALENESRRRGSSRDHRAGFRLTLRASLSESCRPRLQWTRSERLVSQLRRACVSSDAGVFSAPAVTHAPRVPPLIKGEAGVSSRVAWRSLLAFVHLNSERAVEPVRKDRSFAEKQESDAALWSSSGRY